uniref:DUF591 domain-containing protein n=1 Tax=Oryza rufipogon TaxID=4529 RepID=A0A0E0NP40_ORYRU
MGRGAAQGIGGRGADGSGLRRRQPPASKRGKPGRSGGARFFGAGASPPVERARAAPREAGDRERRPGQSKGAQRVVTNGGGRGAACDRGKGFSGELTDERNDVGGTDGVATRRTRWQGGAAPRGRGRGEERERWRPELLVTRPRTHRFLRCSAADGDDEIGSSGNRAAMVVRRQWHGGCETSENETRGEGAGFIVRRRGRFGGGKPTLAVECSAGGSGSFLGNAKAATAWMHWAAKAVDRTAKIESREREELRGTVKVGAPSWRPASGLCLRAQGHGRERERDRVREGKRKRGREKGRVVHAVLGGGERGERELGLPGLDACGVERQSSW